MWKGLIDHRSDKDSRLATPPCAIVPLRHTPQVFTPSRQSPLFTAFSMPPSPSLPSPWLQGKGVRRGFWPSLPSMGARSGSLAAAGRGLRPPGHLAAAGHWFQQSWPLPGAPCRRSRHRARDGRPGRRRARDPAPLAVLDVVGHGSGRFSDRRILGSSTGRYWVRPCGEGRWIA
jgi:hypothetical protein